MTPDELDLILTSSQAITDDPDGFSSAFYETVFEIAPATRAMFPDDMTAQRSKLVRELQFMVQAASAWADPAALEGFVARTRELGRRHVAYGVTAAMYEPVGTALMATLRDAVDGFGPDHEQAWAKLYTLVAETMLEGATTATA